MMLMTEEEGANLEKVGPLSLAALLLLVSNSSQSFLLPTPHNLDLALERKQSFFEPPFLGGQPSSPLRASPAFGASSLFLNECTACDFEWNLGQHFLHSIYKDTLHGCFLVASMRVGCAEGVIVSFDLQKMPPSTAEMESCSQVELRQIEANIHYIACVLNPFRLRIMSSQLSVFSFSIEFASEPEADYTNVTSFPPHPFQPKT